jgi:hypothetical protein
MPFIPAGSDPNVSTATPIDSTLAVGGTAEDLVTVPAGLVGKKLSIVNRGSGHAYIAFDATASATNGVLVQRGEAYSEEDLTIQTKVSFIGVGTNQPNVTGVLWSA